MTSTIREVGTAFARAQLDLWVEPLMAYRVFVGTPKRALGLIASLPNGPLPPLWVAEGVTDASGSLREFARHKEAREALLALHAEREEDSDGRSD